MSYRTQGKFKNAAFIRRLYNFFLCIQVVMQIFSLEKEVNEKKKTLLIVLMLCMGNGAHRTSTRIINIMIRKWQMQAVYMYVYCIYVLPI